MCTAWDISLLIFIIGNLIRQWAIWHFEMIVALIAYAQSAKCWLSLKLLINTKHDKRFRILRIRSVAWPADKQSCLWRLLLLRLVIALADVAVVALIVVARPRSWIALTNRMSRWEKHSAQRAAGVKSERPTAWGGGKEMRELKRRLVEQRERRQMQMTLS